MAGSKHYRSTSQLPSGQGCVPLSCLALQGQHWLYYPCSLGAGKGVDWALHRRLENTHMDFKICFS